MLAARLVLADAEPTTQLWSDSQRLEERGGDHRRLDHDGRPLVGQGDLVPRVVSADPLESPGVPLEVEDLPLAEPLIGPHPNESIGLGVRETSEEHVVDDGKDGRRGAEAQNQRQNRQESEAGMVRDVTDGKAQVAENHVSPLRLDDSRSYWGCDAGALTRVGTNAGP